MKYLVSKDDYPNTPPLKFKVIGFKMINSITGHIDSSVQN